MVHDYNLPIGPWGQEQTQEQLKEQRALCENFELFCASQHLTAPWHLYVLISLKELNHAKSEDFVEKWGDGTFRPRCCYAADYSYFEPMPEAMKVWEDGHAFVTFVSPCPEKGLSIFLRLAESMPDVQFLAVKTVTWTKPWHEQSLGLWAEHATGLYQDGLL